MKAPRMSDLLSKGYISNFDIKLLDAWNRGKEIGSLASTVSTIRNIKGQNMDDLLMDLLNISKEDFDEISEMINDYPDWTDDEIAETLYCEKHEE